MPPLTVIHIFSASYSGSTWLNLVLGSHPDALSVGEVKTILKIGRPVCTLHGEACRLWSRIGTCTDGDFYPRLHELTGKSIFVVNNSRKWLTHQEAPGIRSVFVHLLRDGRAVVASRIRKGADTSLWASCRVWKREVRRNASLLRRRSVEAPIAVRYESLLDHLPGELPGLCGSLGISFDPAMLEYWRHDHHFLGGNRGALFGLLRAQDKTLPDDPERATRAKDLNWDLAWYEKTDARSFHDDRWKQELTPTQRRLFALFAGRFNRRLGY